MRATLGQDKVLLADRISDRPPWWRVGEPLSLRKRTGNDEERRCLADSSVSGHPRKVAAHEHTQFGAQPSHVDFTRVELGFQSNNQDSQIRTSVAPERIDGVRQIAHRNVVEAVEITIVIQEVVSCPK